VTSDSANSGPHPDPSADSPWSDLERPPLRELSLARALVRPGGLWRELRIVAETGSTNADAAADARSGAAEGLVVVAESQSAGRGRLGRAWTAPPRSGLFLSVLLRPSDVPASRWGWLPLLAGTAVRTAVEAVSGVPVRLKWPNDLVLPAAAPEAGTAGGSGESGMGDSSYGASRKLGGILVERVEPAEPEGARRPGAPGPAAVVGLGLNVSLHRDELPAPHATSLLLEGARASDRDPLLRMVLREVERWYLDWTAVGGDPMASGLASAYAASCDTFGRQVRVELPGGRSETGTAVGLDGDGRLVVRTGDGDRAFGAGDVVHLR
jgi:BirA family biotin operon repressor/biotin-[acetyl-CoA-carboxylase] ligase